jgi:hypothetical protein
LGGARKKKGKKEKDNAETQRALRSAEVAAVARVRRADKIWRRKVGATNYGKKSSPQSSQRAQRRDVIQCVYF